MVVRRKTQTRSRQGAGSGAVLWRTCIYSNSVFCSRFSQVGVYGKAELLWVFPALLEQLSERMFLSLRLTPGTRKDWESSFLFCFEVSLCLTQGPCHCIYYLPDTGISVFLSINGLIITRCLCQALLREITLFGLSAARKSWRNLAVRKLRFFISFCTRFPKSTSHFCWPYAF